MPHMRNALTCLVLLLPMALPLSGCSSNPVDPDEETAQADRPEVLGRTRPDYAGQGTLENMFTGGDEDDATQEADGASTATRKEIQRLEQRLSRLERQLVSMADSSSESQSGIGATMPPQGLRARLGVLLQPGSANDIGTALQSTLARVAAETGMPFEPSATIEERLAEAGCNQPTAPGCPLELMIYPGTRVLAIVDTAREQGQAAVVTYRLLDTVLGSTSEARTLRLPATDGRPPQAALAAAADEILLSSGALAGKAQWQTRAFNEQGDQWYVSAGRQAGLAVGDRLMIHEPGRTISTPGGNVAGWVAGARKGVLEITGFAGEGIAVARLVEGQAPTPQDPILAPDSSLAASGN